MKTPLVCFIVLLILVSCQGEKGETGPAGPSLKGNISGFVVLFDSLGKIMSDNSGVKVSIDGSSISTISNSSGKWIISDVSIGTYTITLSKPNYAMLKIQYSFAGGGDAFLYKSYLGSLPTYKISSFTAGRSLFDKTVIIEGTVTSLNSANLVIFFNKNSKVSSDPSDYIGSTYAYTSINGSINSFSRVIYSNELGYMGITSGDKIYVRAYPSALNGTTGYTDPITGKEIITSIGPFPSIIDSVIVP